MALNNQQLSAGTEQNYNKDKILDEKKDPGSSNDLDAKRGTGTKTRWGKYGNSDSSVGGRIGPVLGHLAAYDFGSDDSSSDILGRQLELEAGDAIQYRTCSWQKVT